MNKSVLFKNGSSPGFGVGPCSSVTRGDTVRRGKTKLLVRADGQGRCAPAGRKLPVTRFGGCEAPHASPRPRHEGAERRLSYLVSGRGSRNRAQCSPGTGSKVRSGRADPVSAPPPHCAAVSRSASRCPLCLKRNDRSQGDWRLEVIFKMTADYSRLHCFASGVYEH